MRKIHDDSPIRNALEQESAAIHLPDGTYVNVHHKDYGNLRSANKGLDIALGELQNLRGFPLILYGFQSAHWLFLDKRFMKLMSHGNVHFLRLPFLLAEIPGYLSLPAFDNPALRFAAGVQDKVDLLKIIKHDYNHNPQRNIERARKELGLTGSNGEIVKFLEVGNPSDMPVENAGRLPGVFCDIEGTLWKDKGINLFVLEQLIEYSKEKPVTIWTGGDTRELSLSVGRYLELSAENYQQRTGRRTD